MITHALHLAVQPDKSSSRLRGILKRNLCCDRAVHDQTSCIEYSCAMDVALFSA